MSRISYKTVILSIIVSVITAYDAPDYPGPYCATRSDPCCEHRIDSCSVPISTTLCYCDEFCDRVINGDCCPDYKPVCLGEVPSPIISCLHKGKYFTPETGPFLDNCNKCTCDLSGRTVCENDICLVEDHVIETVNRGRLGWLASNYTEFWGRKFTDGLNLRLGTFEPKFFVSRITHPMEELPKNFNSVDNWPGFITDIRDQGWCGSSWALSTASVASDRFGIQSKGREYVNLAPQQFLSCVRKQQGCYGGHLDAAWSYFRKTGLVEEDCYPYSANTQQCKVGRRDDLKSIGCQLPTKVPRIGLYKVAPAYSVNNETDIMIDIRKYGPVQATMRVYQDFFLYKGGVYKHSASLQSEASGYHSVRIVGWGEERSYPPTKYWIAANSWGTWWGENGYFRIVRGTNECDIEKYVFASWAHEFSTERKTRRRLAG